MNINAEIINSIKAVKAVVLDMDGILVDSEPLHIQSFRILMAELNLSYSEEFIHSFIGFSIEHNIDQINKKLLQGREIDLAKGVKYRDEIYLNLLQKSNLEPMPGIIDLVEYCQEKKLKLALASSSIYRQIEVILDRLSQPKLNFKNLFHTIVAGDHVQHKKPAADIYQRAVKNLNIEARFCLALEDSSAGVQSAKSAGLKCIALQNQYTRADRLRNADIIINEITEVIQIIAQII